MLGIGETRGLRRSNQRTIASSPCRRISPMVVPIL